MQGIFCVTMLLGIATGWIAIWSGHLPNNKTSILIILIVTVFFGLSLSSAHAALLILYASERLHLEDVTLIYALLFCGPVLSLGLVVFLAWRGQQKLVKDATADVTEAPEGAAIQAVAQDLMERMKIESTVEIRCSCERSFSPVALSFKYYKQAIVLPWNLWEMAELSCRGNRGLATELVQLVLAHELGHIRNLDVSYVTLLRAFGGSLIWSFGIVAGACVGIETFKKSATVMILEPRLISILVTGFFLLAFLIRLVIVRREELADQSAAELVSAPSIESLVNRPDGSNGPSPLERFVMCCSFNRAYPQTIMGTPFIGSCGKLGYWIATKVGVYSLTTFGDRMVKRVRILRMRKRLVDISENYLTTIIISGLTGALLFGILEGAILQDFEFFWLRQHSPNESNFRNSFLHAIDGWAQYQKGNWTAKFLSDLGPFSIALFMMSIAGQTAKRRAGSLVWLKHGPLLDTAGLVVLLSICFLFATGFFTVRAIPSVPDFRFIRPWPVAVCFWILAIGQLRLIWSVWTLK